MWCSDKGFRKLHFLQKYMDDIDRFLKNSSEVAVVLFAVV